MFCEQCGIKIEDDKRFCPECYKKNISVKSSKNWVVLLVLSILLGVFGVDRFYAGSPLNIVFGIIKFLTGGGFGIWWIVDIILVICGKFKDAKEKYITR